MLDLRQVDRRAVVALILDGAINAEREHDGVRGVRRGDGGGEPRRAVVRQPAALRVRRRAADVRRRDAGVQRQEAVTFIIGAQLTEVVTHERRCRGAVRADDSDALTGRQRQRAAFILQQHHARARGEKVARVRCGSRDAVGADRPVRLVGYGVEEAEREAHAERVAQRRVDVRLSARARGDGGQQRVVVHGAAAHVARAVADRGARRLALRLDVLVVLIDIL